MNLLQDIFKILHQPVQLLIAALMFAYNDLILSLMNIQAPSEAVTNSPAGHQVLRTATHNILYASANSIGQEVSAIPVPYWLYITVAVVDAGLIALCVFYFVRRRKNVKRWKEQNSVQA